jgi:hypothetical protein
MNKPRLVKREEINRQTATPAPTKPGLTQFKKAVQERRQPSPATSANARLAFAALFATL